MVQGTGPAAQGIGPAVHFPAGRPPSESPGDFPDSGGGSPMVPDSALLPRILKQTECRVIKLTELGRKDLMVRGPNQLEVQLIPTKN